MKNLKRVSLLLRDSDESQIHNIQIMDYLNERFMQLNDTGYAIAVEVVDDDNINRYIKKGVESTPALVLEDESEYGVNAIIATLAKLEIRRVPEPYTSREDPDEAFRALAMREIVHSDEQENENGQSSIRAKGQDFSDHPPDTKDLDSRMAHYESFYAERKGRNAPHKRGKAHKTPRNVPSAKQNVEKLISDKGYDAGEAAFMREISKNLE